MPPAYPPALEKRGHECSINELLLSVLRTLWAQDKHLPVIAKLPFAVELVTHATCIAFCLKLSTRGAGIRLNTAPENPKAHHSTLSVKKLSVSPSAIAVYTLYHHPSSFIKSQYTSHPCCLRVLCLLYGMRG